MRLWHIDLITNGLLPRSQLNAQWRELCSIFKNENRHILINYNYIHDKGYLLHYSNAVIAERKRRGYKVNNWENYNNYFEGVEEINENFPEHDDQYLRICFYNLQEKCIRMQQDFDYETYTELYNYCKKMGVI